MFCPKCGNQISDNAVFCQRCGAKADEGAAKPAVPAYAAQAAPKKPFPLKYVVLPVGILAGAAVIIAAMFTSPETEYFAADEYTPGSSTNSAIYDNNDLVQDSTLSLPDPTNKIKCPDCGGKGKLKCVYCDWGLVSCTHCGGSGQTYDAYSKRYKSCVYCRGGKVGCKSCGGLGAKDCMKCLGKGEIDY